MALDLDAIKKKIAAMNGQRTERSNLNLWKPGLGEHRIRVLPWPQAMLREGEYPFVERSFYFIDAIRGFLAPKQFGDQDPVETLIQKLHKSGDKALAKKLYPKTYAYLPIIVRGEEDKGVQVWKIGKQLHLRFLGFYADEDGGDITDPKTGCDIKVTVSQAPGKQFHDINVDMRKTSPLAGDEAQAQKWLDGVPDINDFFKRIGAVKTTDEISKILDAWLAGPDDAPSEGTERGASSSKSAAEELDELEKQVKGKDAKAENKETDVKTSKRSTTKDLDDAFAELGLNGG